MERSPFFTAKRVSAGVEGRQEALLAVIDRMG